MLLNVRYSPGHSYAQVMRAASLLGFIWLLSFGSEATKFREVNLQTDLIDEKFIEATELINKPFVDNNNNSTPSNDEVSLKRSDTNTVTNAENEPYYNKYTAKMILDFVENYVPMFSSVFTDTLTATDDAVEEFVRFGAELLQREPKDSNELFNSILICMFFDKEEESIDALIKNAFEQYKASITKDTPFTQIFETVNGHLDSLSKDLIEKSQERLKISKNNFVAFTHTMHRFSLAYFKMFAEIVGTMVKRNNIESDKDLGEGLHNNITDKSPKAVNGVSELNNKIEGEDDSEETDFYINDQLIKYLEYLKSTCVTQEALVNVPDVVASFLKEQPLSFASKLLLEMENLGKSLDYKNLISFIFFNNKDTITTLVIKELCKSDKDQELNQFDVEDALAIFFDNDINPQSYLKLMNSLKTLTKN